MDFIVVVSPQASVSYTVLFCKPRILMVVVSPQASVSYTQQTMQSQT